MRINPISTLWSVKRVSSFSSNVQNPILNNKPSDVFEKAPNTQVSVPSHKTVSFKGYDVHIIDGGAHADDMNHFAKAIGKNMDIHMHRAEYSYESNYNKPLRNIEMQLHQINKYGLTDENSYVAVPVVISVSLQNLAEQYKQVMGTYLHLRPHSTQTCKNRLLEFLKRLYENPDEYRTYIKYMDPQNQGLEYAYGIIQEINKMKCRKIYVPTEHPQEETLNWLAGVRGDKPELTNYLATGYDKDNKVHNMLNEIKNNGWYNFNLLTLSKADVVNLKKMDGQSDHIYSAYDTTIKDGARGVYNFSPIRENGKIVGYSFNDTKTNEYPFDEFPHNEEVKDIAKFVGLDVNDVVANDEETYNFRRALNENRVTDEYSNKLYPVWKLFSDNELREQKIYDKGDFVDSKLQHYFRRNSDYKIIYPEADCENSGRPSVMGMWGSCYSMFTAINRDVNARKMRDVLLQENHINLKETINGMFAKALDYKSWNNYPVANKLLSDIAEYIDMEGFDRKNEIYMDVYKNLGDVKYKVGDYTGANVVYNFYLNNLCKNFLERLETEHYGNILDDRDHIVDVYLRLADIAAKRGETVPAKECKRAAFEIGTNTKLGAEVLFRRADDDVNIGDIFG